MGPPVTTSWGGWVEAVDDRTSEQLSPNMSDSYAGRTAYTPPMNVIATKVEPMNMLSGTALLREKKNARPKQKKKVMLQAGRAEGKAVSEAAGR